MFKGCLIILVPEEMGMKASKLSYWGDNGQEAFDKPPVEVGKTNKSLDSLSFRGCLLFNDC